MQFFLSLLTILTVAVFIACQTASSTPTETAAGTDRQLTGQPTVSAADEHESHDDDVKRITPAEAKEIFDSGDALFIDSRSNNAYINEHIKGAINIPVAEIETQYSELPRDKTIIVYCS